MASQTNITLKLDLVENSRITGNRLVRAGFVSGVDTSAPATTLITFLQQVGMPQRGEIHPGGLGLQVIDHDVRPVGPDQAFVLILYEKQTLGGTPVEKMSFRDTTTLGSSLTEKLPRVMGGAPLLYSLDGNSPDPDKEQQPRTVKVAKMPYPEILRNRICYGLFSDPRPATWGKALEHVNKAKFQGLDEGYWLCSYYDEQWSDTERKYHVTVGFTTKQDEDWSTYEFGKLADGSTFPVRKSITDALRDEPYRSGIRYDRGGIMKAGLFFEADFEGIFGKFIQDPGVTAPFNGNGF